MPRPSRPHRHRAPPSPRKCRRSSAKITPRPTRRRRDYFISLAIGNLVLLVATVIQPIYGIAGMIIYNLGLTWIMWFVMEPY